MIAWPWLILAFVVGGNVGLFIMAAIACGREDDRMMEARYEDRDIRDSGSDSGTGGDNRDGGIQYRRRAAGGSDGQPTGRD